MSKVGLSERKLAAAKLILFRQSLSVSVANYARIIESKWWGKIAKNCQFRSGKCWFSEKWPKISLILKLCVYLVGKTDFCVIPFKMASAPNLPMALLSLKSLSKRSSHWEIMLFLASSNLKASWLQSLVTNSEKKSVKRKYWIKYK